MGCTSCGGHRKKAGTQEDPILIGKPGGTPAQYTLTVPLAGRRRGELVWVRGLGIDGAVANGWLQVP